MTEGEAFVFRLCLELGWPHPDYLLPLLTSRQLGDWRRYHVKEPFGQHRMDTMIAILAQTTLAPHVRRGRRLPDIETFIPGRERPTIAGVDALTAVRQWRETGEAMAKAKHGHNNS